MHCIWKGNVCRRDSFPTFPSHYIPCRPRFTAMFVKDNLEHKPFVMLDFRSMLSVCSLAVDHQRKVIKRTRGSAVVCQGGQTFTTCGDLVLF